MPISAKNRAARAVFDGLGETGPVRRSQFGAEELALQAIAAALADANLEPRDVDWLITESTLAPAATPHDRIASAARLTGLRGTSSSSPVGAGILAAIGMAVDMVERGDASTVLTWFSSGWGSLVEGPTQYHSKVEAKHLVEDPVGFSGPPLYFAVAAKRYQHLYGLSDDQLEELLFELVSATRANAALHPGAQLRKPADLAAYRASPMIAEPLRAADCSLLSDGAVAIVVSRHDRMRRKRPEVGLASWGYAADPITDADFYTQSPWLPDLPAARRASEAAFGGAGLALDDMNLLALYDCFSIAVPLQLEAMGFCGRGKAIDLLRGGVMRWDGRLPINTHGGLLSHGYLLGANHAAEMILQLRGAAGARQVPGARRGLVGAGPGRQYTALIMEQVAHE